MTLLLLIMSCITVEPPADDLRVKMSSAEESIIADLAGCLGPMNVPECSIVASQISINVKKDEDQWETESVDGEDTRAYKGRFSTHTTHIVSSGPILKTIDEAGGCSTPCTVTGASMGPSGHFTLYIAGTQKVGLCVKGGSIWKMDNPRVDECH
jgi:hypothetical protein